MKSRILGFIALTFCFAPVLASASSIGFLEINHFYRGGGLGNGVVTYDVSTFDDYEVWWGLWTQCEISGDFAPCRDLSENFSFDLIIKQARLTLAGQSLTTSDFREWHFDADRPDCSGGSCEGYTSTSIEIRSLNAGVTWVCSGADYGGADGADFLNSPRPVCQYFWAGGAYTRREDWQYEPDLYQFTWRRIEVPEPGSFALLGLGLVGLVVSRRRKAT